MKGWQMQMSLFIMRLLHSALVGFSSKFGHLCVKISSAYHVNHVFLCMWLRYWVTIFFWGQISPDIHCSKACKMFKSKLNIFCTNQWKLLENGSFIVHLWWSFYWLAVCVLKFLSEINCKPILYMHFWLCLHFSYATLQLLYDIWVYFVRLK